MHQKNLEPDAINCSAAISASEEARQSVEALELLEEMRQEDLQEIGLKPNVITYNAAISACEKAKQLQRHWSSRRLCSREGWSHA